MTWTTATNAALSDVPATIEDLAAWIDTADPRRVDAVWIEALMSANPADARRLPHPAAGAVLAAVRRAYRRMDHAGVALTPNDPAAAPAVLLLHLRRVHSQHANHRCADFDWAPPVVDALAEYLRVAGPKLAGQIVPLIGRSPNIASRCRLMAAIAQDARFVVRPLNRPGVYLICAV